MLVEEKYMTYKKEVNDRFDLLKENEEELNRIFIDIYDLADELTPEVAEKDITVARIFDNKEEVPESMKGNRYVITKRDVVEDLLSYIVGCAVGRYSPYKDGLIFAGGQFDFNVFKSLAEQDENQIAVKSGSDKLFVPAEQNLLLITDEELFENDIMSYVLQFLEVVYGKKDLQSNLQFIAHSLNPESREMPSDVIRNYFFKEFFVRHCKVYKNRPIYWLFDSGKVGAFRGLMYLHRYEPSLIANVRTGFFHDLQWKYENLIKVFEGRGLQVESPLERKQIEKEIAKYNAKIEECKKYDNVLSHVASMKIDLDLDDGVKVNYQKFQAVEGVKHDNIFSTTLKF